MGGLFAILSNFALFNDYRWSGFVLFTLYHMFDNMDGKHARRTKQASEFGAILDHFVDGTAGIWSGAVGLQYALGATDGLITQGVWAFAMLFWVVHVVHALTGFFELGDDYVSIDEAFIFLSVMRMLYALDVTIPVMSSEYFHYALLASVYVAVAGWVVKHGLTKVKLSQIKKNLHLFASYAVFMVVSQLAIPAVPGQWGPLVVLALFAPAYGLVLWESKDKH
jgi:phosphatidylglycerophosphate synthase